MTVKYIGREHHEHKFEISDMLNVIDSPSTMLDGIMPIMREIFEHDKSLKFLTIYEIKYDLSEVVDYIFVDVEISFHMTYLNGEMDLGAVTFRNSSENFKAEVKEILELNSNLRYEKVLDIFSDMGKQMLKKVLWKDLYFALPLNTNSYKEIDKRYFNNATLDTFVENNFVFLLDESNVRNQELVKLGVVAIQKAKLNSSFNSVKKKEVDEKFLNSVNKKVRFTLEAQYKQLGFQNDYSNRYRTIWQRMSLADTEGMLEKVFTKVKDSNTGLDYFVTKVKNSNIDAEMYLFTDKFLYVNNKTKMFGEINLDIMPKNEFVKKVTMHLQYKLEKNELKMMLDLLERIYMFNKKLN